MSAKACRAGGPAAAYAGGLITVKGSKAGRKIQNGAKQALHLLAAKRKQPKLDQAPNKRRPGYTGNTSSKYTAATSASRVPGTRKVSGT